MRLRLRQLEALHTVAEVGSITRAADELGISQPAVSRLLADLSDQLGFKIFQRRNNVLVPTQEVRFLSITPNSASFTPTVRVATSAHEFDGKAFGRCGI